MSLPDALPTMTVRKARNALARQGGGPCPPGLNGAGPAARDCPAVLAPADTARRLAETVVAVERLATSAANSRQAAPGRRDFRGDEKHSTGVGAHQRASGSCSAHLLERSERK